MAINIIKQGVDPQQKYVSKCPYCGTVFSYEWKDIKDNTVSAWHEHHVICPTCFHDMTWNNNAAKEKDLICETTIIHQFARTQLIPDPEHTRAFAIRRVGYEIRLYEMDTIVPAGIPILFVGTFNTIEEVAGLGSELPSGDIGEKIQIDEYAGNQLLIVDSDFTLRYMDANDKSKYGIIPTQVTINSPVKVIELN